MQASQLVSSVSSTIALPTVSPSSNVPLALPSADPNPDIVGRPRWSWKWELSCHEGLGSHWCSQNWGTRCNLMGRVIREAPYYNPTNPHYRDCSRYHCTCWRAEDDFEGGMPACPIVLTICHGGLANTTTNATTLANLPTPSSTIQLPDATPLVNASLTAPAVNTPGPTSPTSSATTQISMIVHIGGYILVAYGVLLGGLAL